MRATRHLNALSPLTRGLLIRPAVPMGSCVSRPFHSTTVCRRQDSHVDVEELDEAGQQEAARWKEIGHHISKIPRFTEHVLSMNRTAKVTFGGKNLRFKASDVSGDGKGRVGFGTGSGLDSRQATEKATRRASQVMMDVPLWQNRTLFHDVYAKYNSTKVMIRQAPFGWGIVASRVQHLILDAAGVRDAVCKIWGSTNDGNVVRATFLALSKVRSLDEECRARGMDRRRFEAELSSQATGLNERLYRGGDFAFRELTGRDSKYDLMADLQGGDGSEEQGPYPITAMDGGLPIPEGRPTNPKFQEWDRVAVRNMKRFYADNPHLIPAAGEEDE